MSENLLLRKRWGADHLARQTARYCSKQTLPSHNSWARAYFMVHPKGKEYASASTNQFTKGSALCAEVPDRHIYLRTQAPNPLDINRLARFTPEQYDTFSASGAEAFPDKRNPVRKHTHKWSPSPHGWHRKIGFRCCGMISGFCLTASLVDRLPGNLGPGL